MKAPTFSCPICKKAPSQGGYPRRWQWKTEKGLREHRCYKDDAARQAERDVQAQVERMVFDTLFAEYLATRPPQHQIGESVSYVSYLVREPTHKWNGSRMVHVRYEEVRRYDADTSVIEAIAPVHTSTKMLRDAIDGGSSYATGYMVRGRMISDGDIYPTLAEAQAEADRRQAAYDAAVHQAEMYR
jgi:hypothetical protein